MTIMSIWIAAANMLLCHVTFALPSKPSVSTCFNVDEFSPFDKLYFGEEMTRLGQDKLTVLNLISQARDQIPVSNPDREDLDRVFTDLGSFTETYWPASEEAKQSVKQLLKFSEEWQEHHVSALEEIEKMKVRHTGEIAMTLQVVALSLQDFITHVQQLMDRCNDAVRGEPVEAKGPLFDIVRLGIGALFSSQNGTQFGHFMQVHPLRGVQID